MEVTHSCTGIWCKPEDGYLYGITWQNINNVTSDLIDYGSGEEIEITIRGKIGGYIVINEYFSGFQEAFKELSKRFKIDRQKKSSYLIINSGQKELKALLDTYMRRLHCLKNKP